MQYAIFCYHSQNEVGTWTEEHEGAVMGRLAAVQQGLAQQGRLGPVARLMPTGRATTVRKDHDSPLVVDGPFAETKEQLLGFYVVECETHDDAVEVARQLSVANPGGAHEIRPIDLYRPNNSERTPS
jgi:hypothetical protein